MACRWRARRGRRPARPGRCRAEGDACRVADEISSSISVAPPSPRRTARRSARRCGGGPPGHLRLAARVHHRVADPPHQVLAETDLRVHHPGRGQRPPRSPGRRGGRRAWWSRCRPQRHSSDRGSPATRDDPTACCTATVTFHSPLRSACCRLRSSLRSTGRARPGAHCPAAPPPPAPSRRGADACPGPRPRHSTAAPGIELDRARLCALPDDLLVHLAVGRHVDDHVAEQLGLAGQPPPGATFAALIALFDRREGGQISAEC